LQRTEVLEAEEFFSEKQKGSSAMPHKRNPVLSENLTGLARMVRAYALPAMENVALWHERDISHSSVERMIGPDATVILDFALARLASIVDKLVVYPAAMQKNLDRLGGLIHSQRVLIALTQKGVSREDAYRLVQRNAMKVWGGEGDFLSLLKVDKDVRAKLSDKELEANFNLDHHFRHVETVFKRVFATASLSIAMPQALTILVFDSGLGGLTVFREVIATRPDARLIYLADDAGFPYGDLIEERLVARVTDVLGKAIVEHKPDMVVVACNTASTLTLAQLRARFSVPFVGTVPAIKPACARSKSKRIAVLGTQATVGREYTKTLIREFAAGCDVHLVGSPRLAAYAEAELAS